MVQLQPYFRSYLCYEVIYVQKTSEQFYFIFIYFIFYNFINDQGKQHKMQKSRNKQICCNRWLQAICFINIFMCDIPSNCPEHNSSVHTC